jgi:hypothetical protein
MRYKWLIYIITIILSIGVSFIIYNGIKEISNHNEPLGISYIALGVGFLSTWAGMVSLLISEESLDISKQSKEISEVSKRIADDSDRKMTSLAELNFIEKNAMVYSYNSLYKKYINELENDKKLTQLEIELLNDNAMRCIRDIESAIKVIDWVTKDTKHKFKIAVDELSKNFYDKKIQKYISKEVKHDFKEVMMKLKRIDIK